MRARPRPVLLVHRVPRGRPLTLADHRLVHAVVGSILDTKKSIEVRGEDTHGGQDPELRPPAKGE